MAKMAEMKADTGSPTKSAGDLDKLFTFLDDKKDQKEDEYLEKVVHTAAIYDGLCVSYRSTTSLTPCLPSRHPSRQEHAPSDVRSVCSPSFFSKRRRKKSEPRRFVSVLISHLCSCHPVICAFFNKLSCYLVCNSVIRRSPSTLPSMVCSSSLRNTSTPTPSPAVEAFVSHLADDPLIDKHLWTIPLPRKT